MLSMLACWAFMPLAAVYIARIMFVLDLSITGGPDSGCAVAPRPRRPAGLGPSGRLDLRRSDVLRSAFCVLRSVYASTQFGDRAPVQFRAEDVQAALQGLEAASHLGERDHAIDHRDVGRLEHAGPHARVAGGARSRAVGRPESPEFLALQFGVVAEVDHAHPAGRVQPPR